jgi:hypothetical protein
VEVKVWNLRNFGVGNLLKKAGYIDYYMNLLEKYTSYAKQMYPANYQRKSVLGIWFRNRKASSIEDALFGNEIEEFLEVQKPSIETKQPFFAVQNSNT